MKNQFFLIIIFCFISNAAYSMSIELDEVNKAKLIAQVKKENVGRNYWPSEVIVRLEEFREEPSRNGSDVRYFVRAVGSYNSYAQIEHRSGARTFCPVRLRKGTEGYFSKEELESFGINLPQ